MTSAVSAVRSDAPVVDAHVHILPDEILHAMQDWFEREVSWTLPDVTTVASCPLCILDIDNFSIESSNIDDIVPDLPTDEGTDKRRST